VGCMHAHNELVVLNRLLMFSLNDVGEGELHDHAHGVQMPAITGLSEAHLAWLKDYFGVVPPLNETALRMIRGKTGFHYDKLNLDQAVGALTEHETIIYAAEHPTNACYYLGSSLVFSAAFVAIADKRIDTSAMNQTERMAAGVKIALDELNEANFRVHS